MAIAGYVVGIEGEAMLGLGRSEAEAWLDARTNDAEGLIVKRGADVQCYQIADEKEFVAAEEHGDGYRGNAFSGITWNKKD